MSNILDLKSAYVTQANLITDSIDKLECLSAIDTWYAIKTACDAVSSSQITSYSIAGRSVTRQNLVQFRDEEQNWLRIVRGYIGRGGSGLVDLRGSESGLQGYDS